MTFQLQKGEVCCSLISEPSSAPTMGDHATKNKASILHKSGNAHGLKEYWGLSKTI